jgi:FkbM family methyltransferase
MDFEAKLEEFYEQLDLRNATIVDVGAHVGRHAIPFAKQVGARGTVHAFEPIPTIRTQLCSKLVEQDCNNVIIYPFALSDRPGLSKFTYIPNLPEESGLKRRHIYNAEPKDVQEIEVKVECLDDVLPTSHIRVIKMDVEGGELDVLRGSTRTLRSSRPIVLFECGAACFLGYHDEPGKIFDIFASNDYEIFSVIGTRMATAQEFELASRTQAFWDYIAVHRSEVDLGKLLHNN